MSIPKTKIFLVPSILGGGGNTLFSPAPGDMTATPLGLVGAQSIGSVSDLNGDGLADLVVGTPGSNDKAVDAGRVLITLGAVAPGASVDLSHGRAGVVIIDGVSAGDMAGFCVGSVKDLNGDGKAEILLGAPGMAVGAANDAGAGFVIWGKASGGVDLADPFTGGGAGYAIKGQAAGDMAGYAMTSLGDLNGDGRDDILIGAPGQDAGGAEAGAAYVVWGKAGAATVQLANVAAGTGGFRITGAAAGDAVGGVLASLADRNGDGRAEIMLGSAKAHGGAGAVYVVDGKATGTGVDLASLTNGYEIIGAAGDGAGSSVADVGDVNGDGLNDILIGSASSGTVWLVHGQGGNATINLADVAAGHGGVALSGGDLSGMVVLGGQDLNHDGIADLVIGTPHDGEGGADAGAVYVIWGDQTYRPINLAEVAQGIGGAKIVGAVGSLAGAALAFAGDRNGDGTVDLLIGAPGTGESVKVLYTPAKWSADGNVYGSAGADSLTSGYGGPFHAIGAGDDTILGLDGADTIISGDGNDVLDGGAGIDSLIGGNGDDTYVVDRLKDKIVEFAGGGTDTVRALVSYALAAEVENLVLAGTAAAATGNALNNVLTGNAEANVLDGGSGADTLRGGAGNDDYIVDQAGDRVVETATGGVDTVHAAVDWTLAAHLENLVLTGAALSGTGNSADNHITGTDAANTLNGKAGIDTMEGGGGDDTYIVDTAQDQVVEMAAGGNDTVRASVAYALGAEVETLILTGAARAGTGNAGDNTLIGTAFADTLDGAAGADRLEGGKGDDLYLIDNAGDVVVEAKGGGIDTIRASIDWRLGVQQENLELTGAAHHGTGNALANHLTGTAEADTLDGGAGADTMSGGAGDDSYRVDSAGDVVEEGPGGGRDTVFASVSVTLADGVEDLTLTRAGLTGTGNEGDNLLTGSTGNDSLVGAGGNDTLAGHGGADTLVGGAGDDTYLIDSSDDLIVEAPGGGRDVAVLMRDGLTVNGAVEVIRLGGTAHSATGDASDNVLQGGSGGDSLDGGAGNDLLLAGDGDDDLRAMSGHDSLSGGSGNDVYHIHGASAEIEDFLGHDTIDASDGVADQRIDLSGATDSEIENEVVQITRGGTSAGPLDVQFLQDLTGSFADDIATVRGLVPQVVSAIEAVQADATFGVSSFVDKPVTPFGDVGEWVYKQEQGLSADAAVLAATYDGLVNLSGADEPECQLEALMQLALHTADVGYRAEAARFVVLFTDAPFHVAGDGAAGGITTPNNGDAQTPGNGALEDYPLITQVQAALVAANIIPIFAIAGGNETTYQGLVDQLGRGTVVTLSSDSSNIVGAITAGMTAATATHIEDASAGAGNDTVIGGAEDNGLKGNAGNDTLDGGAGADKLDGGIGADALSGGDGNDILVGGAGSDSMSGGAGDDVFVFAAVTDSARGVADLITDFTTGSDKIDLSALDADSVATGDQAFSFIGGAAFSHHAGELRLAAAGVGLVRLLGDVNGDGIAEFALTFDTIAGSAPGLADLIL